MVLANRKYTDLVGVSSFSQDAMKSGERPSSIILEFEEMKASGIVCDYLQLQEGADIYRLKRLRLKNGRIIGMNEQFISRQTGFELHADVLNEKTSIYALYEEQGLHIAVSYTQDVYKRQVKPIFISLTGKTEMYVNGCSPILKKAQGRKNFYMIECCFAS